MNASTTEIINSIKSVMADSIGVADRIEVQDGGKAAQFDYYETRAFGGDLADIDQRTGDKWTMFVRPVVVEGRIGLRFTFTR